MWEGRRVGWGPWEGHQRHRGPGVASEVQPPGAWAVLVPGVRNLLNAGNFRFGLSEAGEVVD